MRVRLSVTKERNVAEKGGRAGVFNFAAPFALRMIETSLGGEDLGKELGIFLVGGGRCSLKAGRRERGFASNTWRKLDPLAVP